jgi:protein AbiQ
MRNTVDFMRLDNGKLGAINFNNMIPVESKNIKEIKLNKKHTSLEETKYLFLLKSQLFWLRRNSTSLYRISKRLYDNYVKNKLSGRIKSRCCDFLLLEEKCKEYNKKIIKA